MTTTTTANNSSREAFESRYMVNSETGIPPGSFGVLYPCCLAEDVDVVDGVPCIKPGHQKVVKVVDYDGIRRTCQNRRHRVNTRADLEGGPMDGEDMQMWHQRVMARCPEKELDRERSILLNGRGCEYLIHVYDIIWQPGDEMFIVMPQYSTDLFDFRGANAIPQELHTRLASRLLKGLEYLHSISVIHRDLKPENVLLLKQDMHTLEAYDMEQVIDSAVITDFGCGRYLTDGDTLTAMMGTEQYRPPEVYLGQPYDNRWDVFSLACVMMFCISARHAFDPVNVDGIPDQEALQRVMTYECTPSIDDVAAETSEPVADLLRAFLRPLDERPFLIERDEDGEIVGRFSDTFPDS